jgi:hypothetical protein
MYPESAEDITVFFSEEINAFDFRQDHVRAS